MNIQPLKLTPCYKEYLWGGTKLKKEFGKVDAPEKTAESWELAYHTAGKSVIADGKYRGKTLNDLAKLDHLAYWGRKCADTVFPIMVKMIDAQQDLSIQVHPSDETALRELGEQGKAEMWYIVDCEPRASIYFGFSKKITREEFFEHAFNGTICEVLNKVPVAKGDVFYMLPGTIHAIGAGIVIAEIQQNSNTTFRIYDFGRKDAHGNLRELHLDRAADVINFNPIVPRDCRVNNSAVFDGFSMKLMFSCKHFKSHCLNISKQARLYCDGETFQHLLCVEGQAVIRVNEMEYPMQKGDSYFMPAALGLYEVIGKCCVLISRI